MNYQADQIRQRNEILEENILKQVDKSFVLCIDPETKLPFMINMGLKMADVCDLDNRPLMMKHMETQLGRVMHQVAELDSSNSKSSDNVSFSSASDAGAAVNKTLKSTKNSVIGSQYAVQRLKTKNPLLNPKNYPFYQKIKRNLYMMEQLLTDQTSHPDFGQAAKAIIQNNEQGENTTTPDIDTIKRDLEVKNRSKSAPSNNSKQASAAAKKLEETKGTEKRSKSLTLDKNRKKNFIIGSAFACSHIMKWSFKNNPNAEAFRKQMLPFYLLKDDSGGKHPRYVEQSTLSQNLSEHTSISLTVYLSREI